MKRDDFLHFLKEHADACFKVAEQLSEEYNNACHEMRSLVVGKLALAKRRATDVLALTVTETGIGPIGRGCPRPVIPLTAIE